MGFHGGLRLLEVGEVGERLFLLVCRRSADRRLLLDAMLFRPSRVVALDPLANSGCCSPSLSCRLLVLCL